MQDLFLKIHQLFNSAILDCQSDCLAISGGLDSSIIAYHLKARSIQGFSVICQDFLASDLTFSQLISKTFDFPLKIISASTESLLEAIEKTIKILKVFNDIEIRNSVVIFLVLEQLKKIGYDKVITGDGADELFAGYHFLYNKSNAELEKEQKRILEVMHFPSLELGKSLGIKVETPFLEPEIIEFAKSIPVELKIRNEKNQRFGKWILRKAYENKIPSSIIWRKKIPMQDGAGTVELTNLFDILISEKSFEDRKGIIQKQDGVKIRTKESLHYYELFRKYHDNPAKISKGLMTCPFCNFGLKKESKFCRMCGSFPI